MKLRFALSPQKGFRASIPSSNRRRSKYINEIYTQEQIKLICYDKERRILTVRPLNDLRNPFLKAGAQNIRRAEKWYRVYGKRLKMPLALPRIEHIPQTQLTQQPQTKS